MNNKEVPSLVFVASILAIIGLTYHYHGAYFDAWKASPGSSALYSCSAIMLGGGFVLISLAIFSGHAMRNNGYESISFTDSGFIGPFIGPLVGTILLPIIITSIIWVLWLITPWKLNIAKTWTIVTAVIEAILLLVQYLWIADEIAEDQEHG